jgi:hypothetical protein
MQFIFPWECITAPSSPFVCCILQWDVCKVQWWPRNAWRPPCNILRAFTWLVTLFHPHAHLIDACGQTTAQYRGVRLKLPLWIHYRPVVLSPILFLYRPRVQFLEGTSFFPLLLSIQIGFGPSHPLIQMVWNDHSPSYSAQIKRGGAVTSLLAYVFKTWCLIH